MAEDPHVSPMSGPSRLPLAEVRAWADHLNLRAEGRLSAEQSNRASWAGVRREQNAISFTNEKKII